MTCEKGYNTFAKRIDPGQPAESAQADLGRYVLLFGQLSTWQRILYIIIPLLAQRNGFLRILTMTCLV